MRPRQPTGLGGCPPHLSHLTDGPRRGWGLPSPSVTCPFVATPDKQNRSSRTDPPLGALVARNRVCLGSFLALGRHRCGAGPEIRAGVATPHLSHSTRGAQLQQGCQNRSKKLGPAVPDQRNRTKFRTNPDSPFDLFILGLIFRLGPAPLRCRPSCPVCNRRLKHTRRCPWWEVGSNLLEAIPDQCIRSLGRIRIFFWQGIRFGLVCGIGPALLGAGPLAFRCPGSLTDCCSAVAR